MDSIEHINIKKGMTVKDLVSSYSKMGFGARRIATASEIFKKMINDKECTKFFGLAGAMVPAGMKLVVKKILENKWADVFVTTGANLTHDIVEALGNRHYIGTHNVNDADLRDKMINRIYDVYMKNEVYEDLEDFCEKIFPEIDNKEMTVKEFLWFIGSKLNDENSILRTCYKKKIPIFCPGISDSGLGLQVWNYLQKGNLKILDFYDLKELIDIAWTSKKAGCLLVGGGVPKNHIIQAMQFSPKKHSYAIQITMDRPEPGGLSGAELREGISWGKLGKDAEYVDVICDATIALPLIVASIE